MQLTIPRVIVPLQAKVAIPGSKSITNRALLLSALAEGVSFLQNVLFSDDTVTLISALRELGVLLEVDELQKTIRVQGCSGQFPCSQAKIHCRDAGTVARFLLAVCANQIGVFEFDGSTRLRERPINDLVAVLRMQGALISADFFPLIINNKNFFPGGKFFVSGHISSQFLSGLLMAAPYFKTDVILTTDNLVSEPYVNMTCSMMRDFGAEVLHHEKYWQVRTDKKYQARHYQIEADFSSASYFFAAAAVTSGKITLLNMQRKNSIQGDSAFLDVLEKMGCQVEENVEGITVTGPSQLKGVDVDMRSISDTMMTLAAIAPFADSPTKISNIGNTRLKESDRIAAMSSNLRQLNIRVEEEVDALTIYPGMPIAGVINCYQDHRIAMACSLIGLKVDGIIIDDVECVNKTFPEFFKVFLACM